MRFFSPSWEIFKIFEILERSENRETFQQKNMIWGYDIWKEPLFGLGVRIIFLFFSLPQSKLKLAYGHFLQLQTENCIPFSFSISVSFSLEALAAWSRKKTRICGWFQVYHDFFYRSDSGKQWMQSFWNTKERNQVAILGIDVLIASRKNFLWFDCELWK